MSETRRRLLLATAFVLFVAASAVAWRRLPPAHPDWTWLALSAAVVPLIILLNALEYRLAASLLGHDTGVREALSVSVLGSAANLLPVPGAAMVRAAALSRMGAGVAASAGATGAVGAAWLGIAGVFAGTLQLLEGRVAPGGGLLALGLVGLAVMGVLARGVGGSARTAVMIVSLETVFVAASALRTWATLTALDARADYGQAAVLTVAAPLASAAGILPGGLGLRELIAGGLAPLVHLPSAVGIVASSIDRLLGLGGLAVAAIPLLRRTR